MSDTRDGVLAFIHEVCGTTRPVSDDEDLFVTHRLHGDDAAEFMAAFAKRFGVGTQNYLWYFHHEEEGWSPGVLIFRPPHARVTRIPVTLAILTEAARGGNWPVEYPEHDLPRMRWDIWLNRLLLAAAVAIPLAVWVWGQL